MTRSFWIAIVAGLLYATVSLALEITSVAPSHATPGTRVVVTGGIFSPQSRIYLGEQAVIPLQLLPRQIEFAVPPLPPGGYSLTVQDDEESVLQPFSFEVFAPHPEIIALEPTRLDVCSDEDERLIRVSGRGFRPGAQMILNGNAVESHAIDADTLGFHLPELQGGAYGIEVRNPDGTGSLPHSLWINNAPEIISVEQGDEFVNHYEMIIRGNNFFFNSILVVREPDNSAGSIGTRQMTYYAHRSAPRAPGNLPSGGESLTYNDCHTLKYLRYPSNFQDKDLIVQVINPDGKKTAPYAVTLP